MTESGLESISPGVPWATMVPPSVPPPESVAELRVRLAVLRSGMSETEACRRLGLDRNSMIKLGCSHSWAIGGRLFTNLNLTLDFSAGTGLTGARLSGPDSKEEVWPQ